MQKTVKKLMQIILVIAAIFLVIVLLVYLLQWRLIFFPERLPAQHRFEFPFQFEEITIEEEGITTSALHFTVAEPQGVVLYMHGNAGSLRSWGFIAEDFLQRQYDVFIYDYPKFGKSRGSISEENLYRQASQMYQYLKNQYSEENILIYGRSIGAAIAVAAAVENQPRMLILEAPFYNLQHVAQHHFKKLPVQLLLRYSFSSNEKIGRVQVPVVILHGTEDDIVPLESGKKLAALAAAGTRFYAIENSGHNDLSWSQDYQEVLDEVLQVQQ